MVMVDELIDTGATIVKTRFRIRPDNIFCQEGLFNEAGLIENMAQTAAARIGSKPSLKTEKPPVGFIGGIRNLAISHYPQAGQEITTTVEVLHEVFNACIVKASVFLRDVKIAGCELKIFLIP